MGLSAGVTAPGAGVFGKYDFGRSRFEHRWPYDIEDGVNILEEGTVLVRKAGSGTTEVVAPSADVADEVPLGIALHGVISAVTFTEVITATVPAVAPFDITTGRTGITVQGANPQLRAVRTDTGADVVTVIGGPGGGQVGVVLATGILTADAALAGLEFRFTYQWTLSALEAQQIVRESHINRGAEALFGQIIVGCGRCEVYTTMYDAGAQFAAGDPCDLGPGGIFTSVARRNAAGAFGRVISVPTTDDPFLGVEYTTPSP